MRPVADFRGGDQREKRRRGRYEPGIPALTDPAAPGEEHFHLNHSIASHPVPNSGRRRHSGYGQLEPSTAGTKPQDGRGNDRSSAAPRPTMELMPLRPGQTTSLARGTSPSHPGTRTARFKFAFGANRHPALPVEVFTWPRRLRPSVGSRIANGPPVALKFCANCSRCSPSEPRTPLYRQDVWHVVGAGLHRHQHGTGRGDAAGLDAALPQRSGARNSNRRRCLYLWQVAEALDFLNARKHSRWPPGRLPARRCEGTNNILLFGDVAKLTDHGLATPTTATTTLPATGHTRIRRPEVFMGALSDWSIPTQPRDHLLRACGPGDSLPASSERSLTQL